MEPALFTECINALGNKVRILTKEESNKVFNLFESLIPFYQGGSRIDWSQVEQKVHIDSPQEIIRSIENLLKKPFNAQVYVLWNDASLPVLETDLVSIAKHFDDITCLGFETWFFNPSDGYTVEYYYLGELNAGLFPVKK